MTERWKKDDPNKTELETSHLQALGTVLTQRPELVDFEVTIRKSRITIQQEGMAHYATIDFRYSRGTAWSPSACKGIRLSSEGSYRWNVQRLTRNYGYDFAKGVLPSIDKLVAAVADHLGHLATLTTQQGNREQSIRQYVAELVMVLEAADFNVVLRGDRHDATLEVAGLRFSVKPDHACTSYGSTGLSVRTHNIVSVLRAWATVKAAMAEKADQ